MRRVSGPLLDRIDLRVVMPRMEAGQLVDAARPEDTATVAERVSTAWQHARERNDGVPNAALRGRALLGACLLDAQARRTLQEAAAGLELTARSVHRTMRVARTIADLRGLARVGSEEILAAASLRDRSMELGMTA